MEYIGNIKILLNKKLDFYTILNPSLDTTGDSKFNTLVKYTSKLDGFIEEYELCEIWRTKKFDSRLYTWCKRNPLLQWRLDLWLISNFFSSSVTNTPIVLFIKTDHSLNKLTLSCKNFNERGPGCWKFNSRLMIDTDYVEVVKNDILSKFDN